MPHFQLFDLIRWIHFAGLSIAGGTAVAALLISGLEDEREEMRGLAPMLWKWVVAWGFRLAIASGILLLVLKFSAGVHPFAQRYLHWKLALVVILAGASELAVKPLARGKRGAALMALLMFLLVTFVVVNRNAFGVVPSAMAPQEDTIRPTS